jgi:hypothetical protein
MKSPEREIQAFLEMSEVSSFQCVWGGGNKIKMVLKGFIEPPGHV